MDIKAKSQVLTSAVKQTTAEDYLGSSIQIYNWIEKQRIDSEDGVSYAINPDGPVDLTGGPVHGKYSLYSGSAGIGIYLLQLFEATGDEKNLAEAEAAAAEIIKKVPGSAFYCDKYETALDSSLKVVGWHTGIYSGPVGAGIFALKLFQKTQKKEYLDFAIKTNKELLYTATQAGEGIYFSGDTDLFSDGGYILYEAALYKATGEEAYLHFARKMASYIKEQAIEADGGNGVYWKANDLKQVGMPAESIYPGFSHGTAGIGYAFAVLYEYDKQPFELEYALKAADYLLHIADEVGDGLLIPYLYEPDKTPEERQKSAWYQKYYGGFCHGPAGTALLYYKLFQLTGDESYLDTVKKFSQGIVELGAPEKNSWGLWNSYCLCCGTPGLVDHFVWMYQVTGEKKYYDLAVRSAAKVDADSFLNPDKTKCFYGYWDRTNPRGVETYTGLYIGAAGAGAALLRLFGLEKQKNILPIFEYDFV